MYVTFGQGSTFLYCIFLGILCGLVYEAGYLLRSFLKKGSIAFIVDIAFAGVCAAIIIPAFLSFNFEPRVYVFLGIICGFILERISIGFFVAKIADKVYNILRQFASRFIKGRLRKFLKRIIR